MSDKATGGTMTRKEAIAILKRYVFGGNDEPAPADVDKAKESVPDWERVLGIEPLDKESGTMSEHWSERAAEEIRIFLYERLGVGLGRAVNAEPRIAHLIREAYNTEPRPSVRERAEAAYDEIQSLTPGDTRQIETIARHFADLEDGALREAAAQVVDMIEPDSNSPYLQECQLNALRLLERALAAGGKR